MDPQGLVASAAEEPQDLTQNGEHDGAANEYNNPALHCDNEVCEIAKFAMRVRLSANRKEIINLREQAVLLKATIAKLDNRSHRHAPVSHSFTSHA